jgi:hypothetical protein
MSKEYLNKLENVSIDFDKAYNLLKHTFDDEMVYIVPGTIELRERQGWKIPFSEESEPTTDWINGHDKIMNAVEISLDYMKKIDEQLKHVIREGLKEHE